MTKILRELHDLISAGRPCAAATLVSTSGSSPQNTGARVLFLPDGRIIGTIGGGCMEAEARRVALDCLRKGAHRLFDLRLDDDFGWDDGLICGGRVSIFIDTCADRSADAYAAVLDFTSRRERVSLCTIVRAPEAREPMVGLATALTPTGESTGRAWAEATAQSVAIGPKLCEAAETALSEGRPRTIDFDEGLSVFVEPILPRPTALIAGAGHIGAALAQILSLCGFEVVVVDDRPSFASSDRLPFADRVIVDDLPRFFSEQTLDEDTYIAIVTRGHRHDAHVLRECIHKPAKYLGMIGSKRKICVIFEELLRDGLATKEDLRRVRSPMGLTLGDREVGEIAVSIAAEVIAIRNGADLSSIQPMQYVPQFLRD